MIKNISIKEYSKDILELGKEHWEEVGTKKGTRSLNIDVNYFQTLEDSGILLSLGAFHDDILIGYSINFITRDTHDCTKLICINDVIFIQKNYRDTGFGLKLIRQTEKEAKKLNCTFVKWHVKPNTNLDMVLEKMKYDLVEFIYMREL
jgi:predicted GNAT superfamily acetyltransferase